MDAVKQEHMNQMDIIMHDLYKQFHKHQSDIEALFPEGITSMQLDIIKTVHTNPEIIIKEVSEYLDLPASTLTNVIDRLEQKNLIRRIVSKRNRRSLGLELTEEGIRINTIHEKAEQQLWRQILNKFHTSDERETLLKFLEVIAAES